MFKTKKINLEKICTGLQQDHASFQTSLTLQITKLQDDLAMKSKIMDALARKTERVKVLDIKLQQSEKQVEDLLSKRVAVRSCITDVTGLLSDIIETGDSMISITICKHLAKKLSVVFAMLHHLKGVCPQSSEHKQGGEGASKIQPPKVIFKPIINKEPKGKDNLIEEPIIDNDEDEEPDEAKLKSRKSRDVN
ncbi:unnamed protein product [Lactuca saligna]|uniref:Uncharacterized protein n=1 Tax=Lactuca saligna TaxID=75948 RepID=A0AA36A330_LACSI|nr:unnamed protein product [Lactuca saligna]